MKKHLFYIIAAAALAGSQFASAAFVLNGSFETNSNNGFSILNWDARTVRAISSGNGISPQDGSFFVRVMDEGASLSQTLNSLTVGDQYELSFYTASTSVNPNALDVSLGGTQLGTVAAVGGATWGQQMFNFTATSSSMLLNFVWDANAYANRASIDNVVVVAVPEPSTYALMGLGALALVVAYRRNRTA